MTFTGTEFFSHRILGVGEPRTRQLRCAVRPLSTDFITGCASISGKPWGMASAGKTVSGASAFSGEPSPFSAVQETVLLASASRTGSMRRMDSESGRVLTLNLEEWVD